MILGIGIGIPFGRRGGFTGVLDLYPNAAMAYSLRKLRAAYSGSAVRIRRSSDNAETDIGFLANGDFDSAAGVSFCGAGNGFITTWYDQSGNGTNAVNAVAASQPQIVASGVVITENTKPAIKSAPLATLNLLRATVTISQPISIAAVLRTPLDRDQVPYGSQITQMQVFRRFSTSNDYYMQAGGTNQIGGTQDLNQTLETSIFDASNSIVKVNGTQIISGDPGTNGIQNFDLFQRNGTLGAFDATIQEMIIYPSNQSANLAAIRTLINSYYGIY